MKQCRQQYCCLYYKHRELKETSIKELKEVMTIVNQTENINKENYRKKEMEIMELKGSVPKT